MLFDPRVQVKAVECDPLFAYRNDDQTWTNVAVEHSASDTAVGRGIPIADQARLQHGGHGGSSIARKGSTMQRWSYEVAGVTRTFSFTSNTLVKEPWKQPSIGDSVRRVHGTKWAPKAKCKPVQL
jgi:hypothetical protein